jgi:hypothetical protein
MDRFIARRNINRFRDRLWSESDPDARILLQRLLVTEEDKLAADLELFADVDQHIADCNRRIERQQALVAIMDCDNHDGVQIARTLLDGMIESQHLHTEYRRRILIKIEQNHL